MFEIEQNAELDKISSIPSLSQPSFTNTFKQLPSIVSYKPALPSFPNRVCKNNNTNDLLRTLIIQLTITLNTLIFNFSSSDVINFKNFIEKLLRGAKVSFSVLKLTCFYLLKIYTLSLQNNEIKKRFCLSYNQDNNNDNKIDFTQKTIYNCPKRLLLSCIIVSSKSYQDNNFNFKSWNLLTGLSINELIVIERQLLNLLDFGLFQSFKMNSNWNLLIKNCLNNLKIDLSFINDLEFEYELQIDNNNTQKHIDYKFEKNIEQNLTSFNQSFLEDSTPLSPLSPSDNHIVFEKCLNNEKSLVNNDNFKTMNLLKTVEDYTPPNSPNSPTSLTSTENPKIGVIPKSSAASNDIRLKNNNNNNRATIIKDNSILLTKNLELRNKLALALINFIKSFKSDLVDTNSSACIVRPIFEFPTITSPSSSSTIVINATHNNSMKKNIHDDGFDHDLLKNNCKRRKL
ncbi:unnamed protein product [[Candida] boidinii]|nr:unnamed protein product [[Candida] boidinii]